ncbi:glycine zipper 2TM domain-containing protein [Vibrio lamellibrachiae]|uniref:glycine zipper 2TM domain-containing protein n=1 Tax=Vibrio lamellibrachiae TaxID=2910253 RepID=UPI003D12A738
MNIKAIALAITGILVLAACKEEASIPTGPTHATITLVEAVTESTKTPHKVCNDVVVTKQAEVKDDGKVLGTLGGAAAGAALGNQVGGGSGKTVATAVGTVAGAMTGRQIQENAQKNSTTTTTERRCTTEYTNSTDVVGYDVTYEIAGISTTVRTDNQPQSNTFPIIDGKVIIPH